MVIIIIEKMMTVNGELPPIQYTHGEAPQLVLV